MGSHFLYPGADYSLLDKSSSTHSAEKSHDVVWFGGYTVQSILARLSTQYNPFSLGRLSTQSKPFSLGRLSTQSKPF